MNLINLFKRKRDETCKIKKFIYISNEEYRFEKSDMTQTILETVSTSNVFYLHDDFNPMTDVLFVKCNGCYLFDGLDYEIKKGKRLYYIILFPSNESLKDVYKELTVVAYRHNII